ncbi:unnamed protein product [marine sediment metagenome]|uniref:Glycosyltransferase 2-like domain-containing protein n=1 Tax=marine sediment metagenome TaxID=412755 RepID=X1LDD0_9ZZZZ
MSNLLGYGALFGLSTAAFYKFLTRKVFDRNAVPQEPPSTSIVMCSLNEEGFVEDALKSLEDQNVRICFPDKFECILIDSHSEDRTVEIAEEYGWTVYQAERGKLNARHLGMLKAKGDIIVSVDADTFYAPNWLNLMLRWFNNNSVVAVAGPRIVNPEENMLATGLSIWMSLIDTGPLVIGGMRAPGQSVAFYRQAYFDIGGWDLSIDQLNQHSMVVEEEIKFAVKLRRLGRMPVAWDAPCFTSIRRVAFLGKGEKYRKFTKERFSGQRF